MKKSAFFTIISIACFLIAVTLTRSEDAQKITDVGDLNHRSGKLGAYRGLIIGINKYKDKYIPSLTTARKDAEETAKLLKERYGFETTLLLDEKATQKAVFDALRELAETSQENDSVLIYYAGHGVFDTLFNDGWWFPTDARFGEPLSYLDNTDVQKAIRSMKARHVLLISDSCYSGTLFGPRTRALQTEINERYYLSLYNEKSRWGMTSGNNEPVVDEYTDGHSIFAYHLLKALKENKKRFIITQEIFTRIAPLIGNTVNQTPICEVIRDVGDKGGQFVFVMSPPPPEPCDKPNFTIKDIGMEFVCIPPGEFMMGSSKNEPGRCDDEVQHKVTLTRGFFMQTTEVTQGQWKTVMGINPSSFNDYGDDCPVEQVSWFDVQNFIGRLNVKEKTNKYRLPTEAEWEYACRAGTVTPFSFGHLLLTDQANFNGKDRRYWLPGSPTDGLSLERTLPVASFQPNKWGLYNMHGNVWEWCLDVLCNSDEYGKDRIDPVSIERDGLISIKNFYETPADDIYTQKRHLVLKNYFN